jgi:hypothetical protein
MKAFSNSVITLAILTVPLFAGGFWVQVADPASNPEAMQNHAVLIAQTLACHFPTKSSITATAEGVVNGVRQTIPLKMIALSTPGAFALTRQWPEQGTWAIKIVATNPDDANYATAIVVPARNNAVQLSAAKKYSHAPTDAEVSAALN